MKDRTNRKLLIIVAVSLLVSIAAIAIGFMGMVDLLDSTMVDRLREWVAPIISIRSDAPTFSNDALNPEDLLARDIVATQMADKQVAVESLFAEWPIIVEDDFSENTLGWPIFDNQGELADLSADIQDGQYQWTAQANAGFVWWSYPDPEPLTDFYAEIEVTQTRGVSSGESGLVFRLVDDLFYLFEISGTGDFSLWLSDPDGWTELFAWTASSAIQTSGTNKLGILALHDGLSMFINDVLVAEVIDRQLESGVVGVAIGLDEAGDEGQFAFDNLLIRAPGEPQPASTPLPDG